MQAGLATGLVVARVSVMSSKALAGAFSLLALIGLSVSLATALSLARVTGVRPISDAEIRTEIGRLLQQQFISSPEWFEGELRKSIDAGDIDDAELLLKSANLVNYDIPSELKKRVDDEMSAVNTAVRIAKGCFGGAIMGDGGGVTSILCSTASDFMIVGDIRDAGKELIALASGSEPNYSLLGLSAAGLLFEFAAPATGGATVPVKAGSSVLKSGVRGKWLPESLVQNIAEVARKAVDFGAIKRAAARGFPRGLRNELSSAINLSSLDQLVRASQVLYAIYKTSAAIDAIMVARTARSLKDIKSAERLSKAFKALGVRPGPVLRTLGSSALSVSGKVIRYDYRDWSIFRQAATERAWRFLFPAAFAFYHFRLSRRNKADVASGEGGCSAGDIEH